MTTTMTIRRSWHGACRRRVCSSVRRVERQARAQEAAGEAEVALAAGGDAVAAVHAAGNESVMLQQPAHMWRPSMLQL
jgi:hypothetical protein